MVRNVASMASLRNGMANLEVNNVASPNVPTTTRRMDSNDASDVQPILLHHPDVPSGAQTAQLPATDPCYRPLQSVGPSQSENVISSENTVAQVGQAQQDRDQVRGRNTQPDVGLAAAAEGPMSKALADYNTQLRVLEQQNARRLLMVRQEREVAKKTSEQVQIQARRFPRATRFNAEKYCKPFCEALTNNPTVFHFVAATEHELDHAGFEELSERDSWDNLQPGQSYYVDRNGSSLIAFTVGAKYKPGNGAAILAGHVDALTAKLKPVSQVPSKAGYLQLGVAPYAGAPNTTWWDRDLSVGGRVLVKEDDKIVTKLVKLDWPIARIPTLAPHFGAAAQGPFNPETQMVPIIGLDDTESRASHYAEPKPFSQPPFIGSEGRGPVHSFVSTQPPRLVKAVGDALGLHADAYSTIVNWELELFDTQPATVGGLDKEFIFAGRIDDKLCSWAAVQALIEANGSGDTEDSSIIKIVGLFDDEEIGSQLRQGAKGNFLPSIMERIVGSLSGGNASRDLIGRTYANSFIVSSDVIHAVNPNFLNAYLENHSPHLNVGVVVSADSNGHMTTDSVSTAILQRCADKVGAKLQVFQIRNDSRSGGTVGPMLSAATGIRAIDAGIPQLSMHSIRATTGSLDPGLGVLCFLGFLNGFESVDKEFR
ncbi:putative peptidase M18 family protein [Teratosphaeria destructans]|uniref:Peptidase M18 family protein n=1 Tax=Teratosphaeria destructans TaxID=418781 RepID=A0A9W7SYH0_9PEZI|nr:putative peptidase M18 family protein [Teratosphaeria destructans]